MVSNGWSWLLDCSDLKWCLRLAESCYTGYQGRRGAHDWVVWIEWKKHRSDVHFFADWWAMHAMSFLGISGPNAWWKGFAVRSANQQCRRHCKSKTTVISPACFNDSLTVKINRLMSSINCTWVFLKMSFFPGTVFNNTVDSEAMILYDTSIPCLFLGDYKFLGAWHGQCIVHLTPI